jgi:S-DNA-T family DNA segregation ATPase FtsK/SpoIIIE
VLFASILMCLSLAHSAGPVGRGMNWLLRGAFGSASYLVPLAALLVAIAAFVRRQETGRIFVGTSLLVVAVSGFTHLIAGTPLLTAGWAALAPAGGATGAILAIPLRTYVGTWAGVIACLFIGALGALITTKTPLRRAVAATLVGLRAVSRVVLAAGRWTLRRIAERASARKKRGPLALEERSRAVLAVVPDALPEEDETEATGPLLRPVPSAAPAPAFGEPVTYEQPRLAIKLSGRKGYQLPPASVLRRAPSLNRSSRGADEVAAVLEKTLRDFEVDAAVVKHTSGPTVTRFEIELGPGVKVNRLLRLADDIAYALGSPDVRLIAPIPGRSAIGVEVPNRDRELVTLGDIVHSPMWRSATHPLTCVLGKDVAGHPVTVNLAEMPHLLVAGATGAGKSSCLNSLIASLLMRARPEEVRLILIDPKMVELTHFDNLPHLLSPVVTHPKRAAETLGWVVREMERRYNELSLVGQRNLDLYNAAVEAGTIAADPDGKQREKLPYIAVFIDELADLMMIAPREVEDSICRITQMARAVGIHLAVATQRPSVDVVTGLIKANIPSRISFAVASAADSRVVLDMGGAEKLVGHGDMLFLPSGTSKPRRVQGAYVSEKELEEITAFVRSQAQADYPEEVLEAATRGDDELDDADVLLDEAMELVVRSGLGSTSMLQRRLKVGFSRAGRLMDLLERKGVVGPQEGSKARAVLITPEQFMEMRARKSS